MRKTSIIFIFLFITNILFAQNEPLKAYDAIAQKKWVDSVMNSMTVDQKIGQLFMIAAYSNKDKKHTDFIRKTIEKYQIGGLIF